MQNHKLLKERICFEIDDIIANQANMELLNRDTLRDLMLLYEVKEHLHKEMHYKGGVDDEVVLLSEVATLSHNNPY